jgi:hypothetical protein
MNGQIICQTSHKPLLAAFKKGLHSAHPKQIQWLKNDILMNVSSIPFADLSRKYFTKTNPENSGKDARIHDKFTHKRPNY